MQQSMQTLLRAALVLSACRDVLGFTTCLSSSSPGFSGAADINIAGLPAGSILNGCYFKESSYRSYYKIVGGVSLRFQPNLEYTDGTKRDAWIITGQSACCAHLSL